MLNGNGMVFDYDRFDEWKDEISAIVLDVCGASILEKLKRSRPKYLEDAEAILTADRDSSELCEKILVRLDGSKFRVHHGTRLTETDVQSVRQLGLQPLNLAQRKERIRSFAQNHSRWQSFSHRLDECIERVGVGRAAGNRENGNVYGCFSRNALIRSCDHYVKFGSEAEQHVASCLSRDDEMRSLMSKHRHPYIISFLVGPREAVRASNPYGVEDGTLPAAIGRFVRGWAYSVVHEDFSTASQRDDFAGSFSGGVPPERIEQIEDIG